MSASPSSMYLAPDAICAVCGRTPTGVAHQEPGVYDPQADRHFCNDHRWVIDHGAEGVRIWTQGWEAGYRTAHGKG